jgi:nitrite reductase (NADH) small subunit/3-phenylpropionate/trans-cinnamate dioxygenase ferredoxin subunit
VGQRIPIGTVNDFPEGEAAVVSVNGKDVAVFRVDGRFYAIDDLCPHMGASLSGGHVEGGVVTCPWHHWRFRLSDGAWADNPRVKTGCYPVHREGDGVWLEVPDRG